MYIADPLDDFLCGYYDCVRDSCMKVIEATTFGFS